MKAIQKILGSLIFATLLSLTGGATQALGQAKKPTLPRFTSIREATAQRNQIELRNEYCGFASPSLRFCVGFDRKEGSYYIERLSKSGERILLPIASHGYDAKTKAIVYAGFDVNKLAAYSFSVTTKSLGGLAPQLIGTYAFGGIDKIETYEFPIKKLSF